jgi:hypothetical protein
MIESKGHERMISRRMGATLAAACESRSLALLPLTFSHPPFAYSPSDAASMDAQNRPWEVPSCAPRTVVAGVASTKTARARRSLPPIFVSGMGGDANARSKAARKWPEAGQAFVPPTEGESVAKSTAATRPPLGNFKCAGPTPGI